MIKKKTGLLLPWVLLVAPLVGHAQGEFQQGTMAFRSEQYLQALESFLQADQKGDSSPTLTYNIGLTYYKLARYEEAAESFQRLTQEPEWRDVAHFQLGLVAEKQGRKARAISLYQRVHNEAGSDKLRSLAASRLSALAVAERAEEPRASTADRFTGVFNVASGSDDNAFGLQDDILLQSSEGEDKFMEYLAWGQYYLSGSAVDGWRVHGFGYGRRYSEFDSLNISAFSAGLSRDQQHDTWQSEFGLAFISSALDGEDLTDQSKWTARFSRPLNNSWLSLAYMPSRHSGGSEFSYLDGWQHTAEARWRYPSGPVSLDLRYRWEANDRDDLMGEEESFSYSPTRHSFGLGLGWQILPSWHFGAEAEYRKSEYSGTNRLTDSDGQFKEQTREGDRLRLRLKSQWQLTSSLRFAGQLETTDNDENFDLYSYDRKEITFSLEYLM